MTTYKHKEYNGYKNYSTWDVSLWLQNNESLYRCAVKFMHTYKGNAPYFHFICKCGLRHSKTPDNIKWLSNHLDYKTLNEEMRELNG